ncbi:MAG: hypothetical protein QM723_17360 [Myxococcaceae bacterium]
MRAATLLMLLPFAALAKDKVAIDAPKPIVNQISAAVKKHFSGVAVKSELPENPSGGDVRKAAAAVGAKAVVYIRKSGGSFTVMVLDASDGGLLEQMQVKAMGNKLKMNKGFETKLVDAIGRAEGPKAKKKEPEPEPEPTKPEPKEEPKKEEPKAEPKKETPVEKKEAPPKENNEENGVSEKVEPRHTGEEPNFLRVAVGGRLFSRRLYWTDDIFHRLAKYDLAAAPMAGLDLDFFPGALVGSGPASWVGINAGFNYALGLGSQSTDMVKYSTTALSLRVSVIGRVPVGGMLEIRPAVGYSMQNFSITASNGSKPPLPNVSYGNLRAGTDIAVKLPGTPVSFWVGGFYDQPLSTGEMGKDYFPRLSVGGFDADFGVGLLFGKVEVRASIDYTRYWYSMNPKPGDSYVAGGAIDDYKGANVSVGFQL